MAVWQRWMLDNVKMTVLGLVIYVTRENRFGEPCYLLRAIAAAFFALRAVCFLNKKKVEIRASDMGAVPFLNKKKVEIRALDWAAAEANRRATEQAAAMNYLTNI